MSDRFDVVIVGNGAIGLFAAVDVVKNFPNLKIAILGLENRHNSASAAAGAMANVFAEMEFAFTEGSKQTNEKYLKLGIEGSIGWRNFLKGISMHEEVITAKNTLVFLKEGASVFEQANFWEMVRVADEHGVYNDFSVSEFSKSLPDTHGKIQSVAKIVGEFALDSGKLLSILENFLRGVGVVFLPGVAQTINQKKSLYIESSLGLIEAEKILVAAGANTAELLTEYSVLPMFQGVGTAFLFKTSKLPFPEIFSNNVIRTVNRGGAQCGFHVVPRKEGFYLGAGNYITLPSESSHRLETMRYLFQTLESELINKDVSYDLVGAVVKGHRPRSIDGLPMIGILGANENIFVATGTNRAGLTWAPRISQEVVAWLGGNNLTDLFDNWNPDRNPISFGTPNEAIEYFASSRVGAAIEHNLIVNEVNTIAKRKSELEILGKDLLEKAQSRFSPKDFVPHPDHWAPILDTDFTCFS